jgi:hypothetical protein
MRGCSSRTTTMTVRAGICGMRDERAEHLKHPFRSEKERISLSHSETERDMRAETMGHEDDTVCYTV